MFHSGLTYTTTLGPKSWCGNIEVTARYFDLFTLL